MLPQAAPDDEAVSLIRAKSRWLLRHLARIDRLRSVIPNRPLISGSRLPFLGAELTLEIAQGDARVERRGESLGVSVPTPNESSVRYALEDWYMARAEEEVDRRVYAMAERFRIVVRSVRITNAATRWGTCSSTGRLRLNWRLLLAPPEILDYMVAHELAHLSHKDHSPAFWARVRKLNPEFAQSERWLKQNGAGLVL